MFGKIIVIKRNGADGAHFPLVSSSCCFGRSSECDIRIQLPSVSMEHCKLEVNKNGEIKSMSKRKFGKHSMLLLMHGRSPKSSYHGYFAQMHSIYVFITNYSTSNPTRVNDTELIGTQLLKHGNTITIVDRCFRFECSSELQPLNKNTPRGRSPRTPKQVTPSKIVSPKAQPPLASTTKGSLVKPLSPRSENVISPTTRSLKGTPQSIGNVQANQTNASQLKTPEQKSDPLDELLDGMSPTSFYKKTTPARALGSRSSQSGVLEAAGDIFVGTTQNQTVVSPKVSHKSTPGKMGKTSRGSPNQSSVKDLQKNLRRKSHFAEENVSPAKRKRVSFGPNLSPEHFDKTLPPKTPIRKGAIPRKSLPASNFNTPQSLLKRRSLSVPIREEEPSLGTFLSPEIKEIKTKFAFESNNNNAIVMETPKGARDLSPKTKTRRSRSASPVEKKTPMKVYLQDAVISSLEINTNLDLDTAQRRSSRSPIMAIASTPTIAQEVSTPSAKSASPVRLTTLGRCKSKSPARSPVSSPRPAPGTPLNVRSLANNSQQTPVSSNANLLGEKSSIKSPISTPEPSSKILRLKTPDPAISFIKSPAHLKSSPSVSTHPEAVLGSPKYQRLSPTRPDTPTLEKKTRLNSSFGSLSQKSSTIAATPKLDMSANILSIDTAISDAYAVLNLSISPTSQQNKRKSTNKSTKSIVLSASNTPTGKRKSTSQSDLFAANSVSNTSTGSPPKATTPTGKRKSTSQSALYAAYSASNTSTGSPPKAATPRGKRKSTSQSTPSVVYSASSTPASLPKTATPKGKRKSTSPSTPFAASNSPTSSLPESTPKGKRKSSPSTPFAASNSPTSSLPESTPTGKRKSTDQSTSSPIVPTNVSPKTTVSEDSKRKSTGQSIPLQFSSNTPAGNLQKTIMTEQGKKNSLNQRTPLSAHKDGSQGIPKQNKRSSTRKSLISPKTRGFSLDSNDTLTSISHKGVQSSDPSVFEKSASPFSKKTFNQENNSTPLGLTQIFRTPKTVKVDRWSISPVGLKRIMKSPFAVKVYPIRKSKISLNPERESQAAKTLSPLGVARLMKTPKRSKSANFASPSPIGLERLLKTPQTSILLKGSNSPISSVSKISKNVKNSSPVIKARKTDAAPGKYFGLCKTIISPVGVKQLMKTPKSRGKNKQGLANLSGISDLFRTPRASSSILRTPKSGKTTKLRKTDLLRIIDVGTPQVDGSNTAKNLLDSVKTKSASKTPLINAQVEHLSSPVAKVISPPIDLKKIVALRAIHGKSTTPKLSHLEEKLLESTAPEIHVTKVTRKTPGKKLWSEIVMSNVGSVPKKKSTPVALRVIASKKITAPKSAKKKLAGRTPKTPKTLARIQAPTTGHADSPETFVVGKKVSGRRPKTPKPLPRKGRKGQNIAGSTALDVSLSGIENLFQSPNVNTSVDHTLFADIPDTPNGPGEMLVSPISAQKGNKPLSAKKNNRKSANLIGIRDLFHTKRKMKGARLSGIKRLLTTPRSKQNVSPSLEGISRLMKTPKTAKHMTVDSPSGLQRIFTTPDLFKITAPISSSSAKKLKTPVTAVKSSDSLTEYTISVDKSTVTVKSPLLTDKSPITTSLKSPALTAKSPITTSLKSPALITSSVVALATRSSAKLTEKCPVLIGKSPALAAKSPSKVCSMKQGSVIVTPLPLPVKSRTPSVKAEESFARTTPKLSPVRKGTEASANSSPKLALPVKSRRAKSMKPQSIPLKTVSTTGLPHPEQTVISLEKMQSPATPVVKPSSCATRKGRGNKIVKEVIVNATTPSPSFARGRRKKITVISSPAKVISSPVRHRSGRKVTFITPAKHFSPSPVKQRGRIRSSKPKGLPVHNGETNAEIIAPQATTTSPASQSPKVRRGSKAVNISPSSKSLTKRRTRGRQGAFLSPKKTELESEPVVGARRSKRQAPTLLEENPEVSTTSASPTTRRGRKIASPKTKPISNIPANSSPSLGRTTRKRVSSPGVASEPLKKKTAAVDPGKTSEVNVIASPVASRRRRGIKGNVASPAKNENGLIEIGVRLPLTPVSAKRGAVKFKNSVAQAKKQAPTISPVATKSTRQRATKQVPTSPAFGTTNQAPTISPVATKSTRQRATKQVPKSPVATKSTRQRATKQVPKSPAFGTTNQAPTISPVATKSTRQRATKQVPKSPAFGTTNQAPTISPVATKTISQALTTSPAAVKTSRRALAAKTTTLAPMTSPAAKTTKLPTTRKGAAKRAASPLLESEPPAKRGVTDRTGVNSPQENNSGSIISRGRHGRKTKSFTPVKTALQSKTISPITAKSKKVLKKSGINITSTSLVLAAEQSASQVILSELPTKKSTAPKERRGAKNKKANLVNPPTGPQDITSPLKAVNPVKRKGRLEVIAIVAASPATNNEKDKMAAKSQVDLTTSPKSSRKPRGKRASFQQAVVKAAVPKARKMQPAMVTPRKGKSVASPALSRVTRRKR